ncbi:hypothetical protein [Salinibacterium sp. GXW1014]|uniref:hypothetical protein n=1 Tax=Salinibacterium sp. GXW1014 TaxID=3377838 RepID=UPI003839FE57
MAKGISIGVGADTRDFSKAVSKGVIDPLEDAQDALDDVARDGDKAGDKLERSFKDAQKQTEKYGREFSPLAREMDRQTKRGADDVARNTERGFDRAEQAAGAFKDEAVQNFAETASSFDGSMDSIADMAQSTLGGLATAIPGIGLGLAGLGAVGGMFYNQWRTAAEDTEARIASMYDDMLQSGLDFLSEEAVTQGLNDLFNPTDDAGKRALEEVTRIAKDTGLSIEEVGVAWVTSGQKRDEVHSTAMAKYEAEKRALEELQEKAKDPVWADYYEPQLEAQTDIVENYREIAEKMRDLDATEQDVVQGVKNARAATDLFKGSMTEAQKEATKVADEVAKIPDVSTKTVRLSVDDSAVKNWRPPMLPPAVLEIQQKFGRRID